MSDARQRVLVWAGVALAAVWLLGLGGCWVARQSRVTADKLTDYLRRADLARLSSADRARALRELARQVNALPLEERRKARRDPAWRSWFEAMTDEEKVTFVEATLPTGFKQMLTAFEELPTHQRKKVVEDTLRRLKRVQQEEAASAWPTDGSFTNPPPLSEELQKKIVALGLKTFYSESSAQAKLELAPVLEELQRTLERGRLFRR